MSTAELEYELEKLPVDDQIALLDRALEKRALANAADDLGSLFQREEEEKGLSWDSHAARSGK